MVKVEFTDEQMEKIIYLGGEVQKIVLGWGSEKVLEGLDCCEKKKALAEWYKTKFIWVYKEFRASIGLTRETQTLPNLGLDEYIYLKDELKLIKK